MTVEAQSLESLLADHQPGHSEFQIERFITTRGNWTPYGRFKQVLREIDKRRRGLSELRRRRELTQIDIEEAAQRVASPIGALFQRLSRRVSLGRGRERIRLAQLQDVQNGLECEIEETSRELAHFERLAGELRPLVGDLTEERRRRLDQELWNVRARVMAASDLMAHGTLSEATLDLLISMPVSMRTAILNEVRATMFAIRQGLDGPLLDWLERFDAPSSVDVGLPAAEAGSNCIGAGNACGASAKLLPLSESTRPTRGHKNA